MMSAKISTETRRQVYRRDGFRCALCDNVHGLQIHHFIPRSAGGSNQPMNLVTLCWKCHAVVHGTRIADYPDYVDADFIEQAIAEYLGDLYASQGKEWYPFGDD